MSQPQMDVSHTDRRAPKRFKQHEVGAPTPVLDALLLSQVQQLNLDYLELLMAERSAADCATQLQHMSPVQRAALAGLNAHALRALAATSYTLYSLGFEDEGFWASMPADATEESATSSIMHRYSRTADVSAQYAFCKLALLHAWHVAATNPLAARVVYAMPHATAQRLATLQLWRRPPTSE